MPNGRPGDHPLTDMLVHGKHPFPPDMEQMLRQLYAIDPDLFKRLEGEPFYWENGQRLDEGRELLRRLLAGPADSQRDTRGSALSACAPLPALLIGIVTMRQLGVSTLAWSINIIAAVLGLLIWAIGHRLPPLQRRSTHAFLTAASIAAILLPFASEGMLGVHRWVSLAGLRLHASAIAAPLIILCVAAAASRRISSALAIAATGAIILALQPDAAQAISFAAACAVVLLLARPRQTHKVLLSVAVLAAVSAASFVRHDPLPPVAHVEGIFGVVSSRGAGWAAMATVALLLLPLPFFTAWHRNRRPLTLALGVYVAMTLLAPAWGAFPVPVMGAGASPILGYFIALAAGAGRPSQIEEVPGETPASAHEQ